VEYGLLIAACALLLIVGMLFMAGGFGHLYARAAPDPETHQPQSLTPPVVSPATCDPAYDGACIPHPPPDLDCADIQSLGISVPVTLAGGNDPHGLDPDGNGLGCD
jgi:micrococcal nuclease